MEHEELIDKLKEAVTEGEEDDAAEAAEQAIAANMDPMVLVKQAIQPAMDVVGQRFEDGEAYLPELILSGDAARAALDLLIPLLSEGEGGVNRGTVVIGTLYGDNHDIGKNIVSAILAAHGIKVIDLGINVPPRDYIDAAEKEGADIIAASTLITTSLPYQRQIIQTLQDSGRREKYYVIVGGGPVTPEWAQEIGADGYGRDANDAAAICRQLLEGGVKPPLTQPIIEGALKH